jgi:hypothetical protein
MKVTFIINNQERPGQWEALMSRGGAAGEECPGDRCEAGRGVAWRAHTFAVDIGS